MNRTSSTTMIAGWLLVTAGLVAGCRKDPPSGGASAGSGSTPGSAAGSAAGTAAAVALDLNRPDQCGACHQAVVAEWEQSQHRRAHTTRDPIYAALHQVRSAREGADVVAKNCAGCHNPAGATAELADLGVACATCHQTRALDRADGKLGLAALVRTGAGEITGPHGLRDVTGSPHVVVAADPAVFDGSSLCLACHDELKNKDGIASCSTGTEWRAGRDARTCVDCHMPWVETPSGAVSQARPRHRAHTFVGPHAALRDPAQGLTKEALGLSASLAGATLEVTLDNRTQHAWPTGFPGRFALVSIVGFDRDGREVWRNVTDDPMKQHPEAVLNKVYVDAQGAPSLAPYATKLARDNRLRTGESRTVRVAVPATVASVEVSLVSRMVAPPLARTLGLGDLPELKPRVVATARASR
ncbi:MAG: hypothetical protein KBG28_23170 [Kofleriaceae bacterium]|nr:hypothetical protein [Kofleriaceae bacterium]